MNMKYIIATILCGLMLSLAVPVFAQDAGPDPSQEGIGGIIHCGRDGARGPKNNIVDEEELCNFNDLIISADRLVRWLVFIATFFAAGALSYAGYLYVTAAGNEEQVKKAHEMAKGVLIGFIVVLAGWLIVYTISTAVLKERKGLNVLPFEQQSN